mmetsp:Transcript_9/g.17  ORF Transcript_9/g.17 Transcript_9/m.17 type:complete len:238 (+) Transcript_9:258-971(+)
MHCVLHPRAQQRNARTGPCTAKFLQRLQIILGPTASAITGQVLEERASVRTPVHLPHANPPPFVLGRRSHADKVVRGHKAVCTRHRRARESERKVIAVADGGEDLIRGVLHEPCEALEDAHDAIPTQRERLPVLVVVERAFVVQQSFQRLRVGRIEHALMSLDELLSESFVLLGGSGRRAFCRRLGLARERRVDLRAGHVREGTRPGNLGRVSVLVRREVVKDGRSDALATLGRSAV